MANVYFVKMNDPNQVNNYEFIDPTPGNFPDLETGDLCFVRLEGEYKPSSLKRLWDFVECTWVSVSIGKWQLLKAECPFSLCEEVGIVLMLFKREIFFLYIAGNCHTRCK